MDVVNQTAGRFRIAWTVLCLLLYLATVRSEFPVIAYQTSTAGNNEIFQIYNTSQLTRSEAETVCKRCTNGELAIISDSEIDAFVTAMILGVGIRTGRFWLGLRKTFSWKWEDGNNITFEKWAVDHPYSGTSSAEVDIADGLWYSQGKDSRQTDDSYVICQYTNSGVGLYEADWSSWGTCDVISEQQVRTKLCMSPAGGTTAGCKCEGYQKNYQDCEAESKVIIENGPTIYELYEAAVNWYQAEQICGRCETGTIVIQETASDKQFLVDNLVVGSGWFDQYFVGLTTELVPPTWTWLNHQGISWDNWALFNPSSDPTKTVACATKLSSHQWYSCRKEDVMKALLCQYQESGKGVFGEWQPWGACFALGWLGAGRRFRKRYCTSPDPVTVGACTCDVVSQEQQSCTTDVTAVYSRENDTFVLFNAAGTGIFSELVCINWCPGFPGTLVQYQTMDKFTDVYNNLIRPNLPSFTDHFIGLRDENTEGVWRWLDGTQIPGNWNWWAVAEPTTGFLKSSAILRAHVTPEVRTAMHLGSSASSDNADFIVCEYVGVSGNGIMHPWTPWSACNAVNMRTRSRTCQTPVPTMSGCMCVDNTTEEQPCGASTSTSISTSTSTTPTTTSTTTASPTTTTAQIFITTLTSTTRSPTPAQFPPIIPQTVSSTTSNTVPGSSTSAITSPTTSASLAMTLTPNTSSSTSSPSAISSSSGPNSNKCYCPTLCQPGYFELTLEEKVAKLIKDLSVNKEELSATIRKKTSVYDDRVSARGIGLLGCTVLLLVLLTVFMMDFGRLVSHCMLVINRIRYRTK